MGSCCNSAVNRRQENKFQLLVGALMWTGEATRELSKSGVTSLPSSCDRCALWNNSINHPHTPPSTPPNSQLSWFTRLLRRERKTRISQARSPSCRSRSHNDVPAARGPTVILRSRCFTPHAWCMSCGTQVSLLLITTPATDKNTFTCNIPPAILSSIIGG